MPVNRILKARMVEHFGSQWAFATAIKWHESAVSRVVRDRRPLKAEDQKRWAKRLHSTVEELFGK